MLHPSEERSGGVARMISIDSMDEDTDDESERKFLVLAFSINATPLQPAAYQHIWLQQEQPSHLAASMERTIALRGENTAR